MARIPDELKKEILARTDIVALVGETVELKRSGTSMKGRCPFHSEKSPSFHVYPGDGHYHCFGCRENGDAISFLEKINGLSFREALEQLAARAGITIPDDDASPDERRRADDRQRLYRVNALATEFFRQQLLAPDGAEARAYLESRGIGEETAAAFALGFAPEAWDRLGTHLARAGVPPEDAEAVGLIAPRKTGRGHYDRFRRRLVCPVQLPAGETVAFSGRTLPGGPPPAADADPPPKYYNSPESPIFHKGSVLFGLKQARASFRTKKRAILVEGNFDVVALHQAGFSETVAPLGTALTPKQIDALRLLVDKIILCFDGDAAGRAATLKSIAVLVTTDVEEVRVALLPAGEDPDSYLRKHGSEALGALLDKAPPAIEYFIHDVWGSSDLGSGSRRESTLREAAAVLCRVANDQRRAIWGHQLATALSLPPQIVARAMREARLAQPAPGGNGSSGSHLVGSSRTPVPANGQARPAPGQPGPRRAPPREELHILAVLHEHPALFPRAEELGVKQILTDERLRDMYSAALGAGSFRQAIPDELSEIVHKEVFAGEYRNVPDPGVTLDGIVRTLQIRRLEFEVHALEKQMATAQRSGDDALVQQLSLQSYRLKQRADELKNRPEVAR